MGLLFATRTGFTLQALRLVRNPHLFKWYAVTLLALVIYVYANEVERRRWDIIAAGLAVWLADWFNEIVNALVLQATDRAALWTTTGPTAYQFLVGLNVEIMFMFALAGIVYVKLLPTSRAVRILGMPNRLAVGLGLSIISVAVELFLHTAGVFHWEYWWWNTPFVLLIIVFGYLWFFLYAAWVYDAPNARKRWTRLGVLATIGRVRIHHARFLVEGVLSRFDPSGPLCDTGGPAKLGFPADGPDVSIERGAPLCQRRNQATGAARTGGPPHLRRYGARSQDGQAL